MHIFTRLVAYYIDRIVMGVLLISIVYNVFCLDGTNPIGFVIMACDLFPFVIAYSFILDIFDGGVLETQIYLIAIGVVLIEIIINTLLEYSKLKATLGKLVLGLKVADMNNPNSKTTFCQILTRNIFKQLTVILFYIPVVYAILKRDKYMLHEKIFNTIVIRK